MRIKGSNVVKSHSTAPDTWYVLQKFSSILCSVFLRQLKYETKTMGLKIGWLQPRLCRMLQNMRYIWGGDSFCPKERIIKQKKGMHSGRLDLMLTSSGGFFFLRALPRHERMMSNPKVAAFNAENPWRGKGVLTRKSCQFSLAILWSSPISQALLWGGTLAHLDVFLWSYVAYVLISPSNQYHNGIQPTMNHNLRMRLPDEPGDEMQIITYTTTAEIPLHDYSKYNQTSLKLLLFIMRALSDLISNMPCSNILFMIY